MHTQQDKFWFGETPALVEKFEKLSVIASATNKRDESVFEPAIPKARKEESEEDVWDELSLQQLFSEETKMPDLIDFVSDNSMVAMIGESSAKPFDPCTLSSPSKMPQKNWITFFGPTASKEEMVQKLGLTPRLLESKIEKTSRVCCI